MEKDIKLGKGNTKDMPLQMDVEQYGPELKSITFGEFSKVWFYGEYSRRFRPITVRENQYYLEKHVLPYFKDKFLNEIIATDIEEFHAQKREKYSERTMYGISSFLSTLFRAAVEKGIIDQSPMKGTIKIMKKSKQTFVPLRSDEIFRLLNVAEQEGDGVIYEFTLSTGVRLGELLALSWNDIDFEKQTVTIKKTVTPIGNGKEQIEQIRSGFRTIALSSNLITKLKEHKEMLKLTEAELGEEYHHNLNLVFPNNKGEVQKPSVVKRKFSRLINKADVKEITFHDLRKMHAVLQIKAGISYEIIMSRLRHKKLETTLKSLYPHSL